MQADRSAGPPPASVDAPATSERRYLTILFSDLSESTRIAAAMEAEDYAELLGALRTLFARVVGRHGGEIVRIDGDGVTVIFGYPERHEDDGRRAVETALDLHEGARRLRIASSRFARGLRLHTGIHSGLVLLGAGDLVRGRYEMLGDATNVAARLSDLAAADEIIVSEATLGSDRHFFATGETRAVDVRGKDRPLATLSIVGRSGVETRFETRRRCRLTPFVGRDAELDVMGRGRAEAAGGGVSLVVVVGAAGLGKTRLVTEFLDMTAAEGFQVHRGYCESYLGARPLQPFLHLLRSILGIEADASEAGLGERVAHTLRRPDLGMSGSLTSIRRLLSLVGGDGDHAAGGLAATEAAAVLSELIGKLARAAPLALFIDDWQWADDASRQALDALRGMVGRHLLLLLATREFDAVDARMSGARLIALSPLSRQESEINIGAMLPAPPPFVVARIADYAGGNPLFIEELCHALAHDGGPQPFNSGGAWLDALIESRFSRLPRDQAALVMAASVIGHMIPCWLFEDLTGARENDEVVADLARRDFIFPGEVAGLLRFKHGITRDAIYRIVGLQERRALHLRVVQALHQRAAVSGEDEHLEALAYHCGAGGDMVQAARYAERAGDKAMAASALDRAQAQFRAALTALESLDQTPAILDRAMAIVRKYGLACVFDPSRDQLAIFERASRSAAARGDDVALAWSEYWLGYINYGLGQCRKSIAHCQRGLRAAVSMGDDKLALQIRGALGQAHATACEYVPALSLLGEAIEVKRRQRPGAHRSISLAYSISCRGFVLADQGRFDEAHAHFEEAFGALGGALHQMAASVLTQRSAACLWQGRMDEAAAFALEGGRVAEQVKARYLFSMAGALAAYARWSVDAAPEALRAMEESTAWLEASESRQFLSLNFGWLAEAMVAQGRIDEARGFAARALLRARMGDRLGEAMALRALGRAAARGLGRRPAGDYLRLAIASANARGSPHEAANNRLCAAEIALAAGDRDAASLFGDARAAFADMEAPWFLARTDQLAAGSAAAAPPPAAEGAPARVSLTSNGAGSDSI